MNKFQEAIKELENGIKLYVNRMIDKSPKDMTYSAIVHSVGLEGYNVKLNNQIYENIPTIGGICVVNEIVRILIPQNNYNNMVILKSSNNGGGSGGAVNSVNGQTGDVVLNYQDVGALSGLTIIPTKTSQLTNNSDFIIDSAYVHTDNNFTNSLKQDVLDNSLTRHTHNNKSILDTIVQSMIDKWNTVNNKVDKIDGKGLSTNDYTTVEKDKLKSITNGAEVNVQSDWNSIDNTLDNFIKNKPTKLSQFENDIIITSDFELTVNLDGSLNLIYNGE